MLSAAPPRLLISLFAWRIGRSFEKEVALVCSRVNEINIPAAPDLGGAQRAANRGEIWQHLLASGARFPSAAYEPSCGVTTQFL
jgi:hypothetical protein